MRGGAGAAAVGVCSVVAASALAGCWLSHGLGVERDGGPGVDAVTPAGACVAFGPRIEITEGVSELAITATAPSDGRDVAFGLAWNDRRAVTAAIFDARGVAITGPVAVGPRGDTVAVAADGDGVRAFWLDGDLELWSAALAPSGVATEARAIGV
ncbi:MAG: hypothetical protein M3Y87_22560, partial [Myxococcota bacterium]|nr:hypothetical protein [Myxococcota bacterium]